MQKVNLLGLKCPMPLIKFKKVLAESSEQARFEVHVNDAAALKDFPVFCKKLSYECSLVASEPHIIFQILKQPK